MDTDALLNSIFGDYQLAEINKTKVTDGQKAFLYRVGEGFVGELGWVSLTQHNIIPRVPVMSIDGREFTIPGGLSNGKLQIDRSIAQDILEDLVLGVEHTYYIELICVDEGIRKDTMLLENVVFCGGTDFDKLDFTCYEPKVKTEMNPSWIPSLS